MVDLRLAGELRHDSRATFLRSRYHPRGSEDDRARHRPCDHASPHSTHSASRRSEFRSSFGAAQHVPRARCRKVARTHDVRRSRGSGTVSIRLGRSQDADTMRTRLRRPTVLIRSIGVASPEATRSSRRAGREYRHFGSARGDRLGSRTASRWRSETRARRAVPHPASPGRVTARVDYVAARRRRQAFCSSGDRSTQVDFFGGISGLDDWSETARIRPGLERREASSPAASHARRPERERQPGGRDGC